MKRYGCLFERVVDPDNLRLAYVEARRGKAAKLDVLAFGEDLDEHLR